MYWRFSNYVLFKQIFFLYDQELQELLHLVYTHPNRRNQLSTSLLLIIHSDYSIDNETLSDGQSPIYQLFTIK